MSTGGGGAIGGGVPCMMSNAGGWCGGEMGGDGYGQYRIGGGYGVPIEGGGWWPISGGGPEKGEKFEVGGGNGGEVIRGPPA